MERDKSYLFRVPEICQDFYKSLGVLRIPSLKRTCKNNAIIAPLRARR
uniref:Uncharacterized protein n=1 Tax=virus sp. ct5rm7 TaxID=2827298 RepID=A0A8S5RGL8_9VIRU|nr:MAG TPA: hypothetical protein [virus sp. ct5rm7]